MPRPDIPVLVGLGQHTQARDTENPLDPVGLMARTARLAFADTGAPAMGDLCDSVWMVNIMSWSYRDAPGLLCRELGVRPRDTHYMALGGDSPQVIVNKAARAIARGETQVALLAGAESGYAVRRARTEGIPAFWPPWEPPEKEEGDTRDGTAEWELRYDLIPPAYVYALFENALRAARGQSIHAHRKSLAKICGRLSRTARDNPFAWDRSGLSGEELVTPSAQNRLAGFPYTLRMCANLHVDQAACVVMCGETVASALGVPPEKWVYPMGGASLTNVWHLSRRPALYDSPAIKEAAALALGQAGLSVEDLTCFDLYSCFPVVVQMALDALGVSMDDPRGFSLTGGLPYFGGPGSNYTLHGICEAMGRIRRDPSAKALVTGLGWYNTKHAVGIYGKRPGKHSWEERDDSLVQARIDRETLPVPVEKAEGPLRVEAYVIWHDPKGVAEKGIVAGRLGDGRRVLAYLDAGRELLERFEREDLAGYTLRVRFDGERERNLASAE
jgi:acetyl-CoA C-acetyltransferase